MKLYLLNSAGQNTYILMKLMFYGFRESNKILIIVSRREKSGGAPKIQNLFGTYLWKYFR